MRCAAAIALGTLLAATPAAVLAHIDTDQEGEHVSRYGPGDIKNGPCGRVDGARGDHVYTYAPGETITVSVRETIAHPGYFRIAFDADGDDDFLNPQTVDPINRECMDDPADRCGASDFYNNDAVLMDNLDPHDPASALAGASYSWEVELPDVECDNCTLQILQVMTDDPGIHAPYDPSPTSDDLYYQCIDLVLKRGTPAGGLDPEGNMIVEPGEDDTAGDTGGGGGCSLSRRKGSAADGAWLWMVVGLAWLRRRHTARAAR